MAVINSKLEVVKTFNVGFNITGYYKFNDYLVVYQYKTSSVAVIINKSSQPQPKPKPQPQPKPTNLRPVLTEIIDSLSFITNIQKQIEELK